VAQSGRILHAPDIWAPKRWLPIFHAHNIINLRQANFHLGYNSTTNGLMWEWVSQLDSAPQIGPETTIKVFLMLVGTWSAVGENLFFY